MSRDLTGDGSAIGAGDQQHYYHPNDQGSTYALSDGAGTIVEGYLYDAYGGTTVYQPGANGNVDFGSALSGSDDVITGGGSSAVANPYLYTGRRLDAETGLYYYRTRYMDTSLGRFISRDTIGIWGDMAAMGNGYVYVASNPLNNVDPMGLAIYVKIKGVKGDVTTKSQGSHGGKWFTADSFSFGVEREMKESGEKGGTADINIGVGELQECSIGKSMDKSSTRPMPMPWDNTTHKKFFTADSFSFGVEREMKESGEKGGTQDINIGVGELQECASGSCGEEIFTDKYGRVKVQFYGDRKGENQENSSCWIRVAQVHTSKESRPSSYLKYKLTRAFVKSWSTSGTADDRPTEEVAFYFNKIAFEYQTDDRLAEEVAFYYNKIAF
jgi:RHS repeat-associated protein